MANAELEITPQELKRRLDAGGPILLVDVREPAEHAVASIAGSELIPMNSIPAHLQHLESVADDGLVVAFCHHGVRSLHVVAWLHSQGLTNAVSMMGGIDRWSSEIDPSVPKY